jgi:hypothetical protein
MTIKNNPLDERLNDFKNNKSSPEDTQQNFVGNSLQDLLNSFITLLVIFIKSFVFGYSIKLIFNADWRFFGLLCVGLSVNFVFQFLDSLVHNNNL